MKHTEAQCRADAAREAAAGDPDQCVGPFATELTAEQVCNIGFAVLRRYDDDKLWRALTYETGPYDLTMASRPLQELGAAFYAAGYAAKMTMRVEMSADSELLRRAMKAETEAALLREATRLGPDDLAAVERIKDDIKTRAAQERARFAADLRDFLRHVIDMGKHDHYWDAVRLNAEALLKRDALAAP